MEKINFTMGLHCHQPVDNFRNIFDEAYKKSYEPFLTVLERHPKIKLSLHYSGSLLDWIVENKPQFLDKVKRLIDRQQVEILTGGYFEPILPMVPVEDAKGQIKMLTEAIKKHFDFKPFGIWIAERVWDPALSSIFKDLNIRYTILDDFHLKQASVKADEVFGHYHVEGFNNFSVFASIKKLRYTMPFREPEVTIDFLRKLREKSNVHSVTFGDDCEKFGLWPYTYNWVYKKGWLEKFFRMLEENDWIKTMTFGEALKECDSMGKIEIPHSSYAEMIQWSNGNFNNFFEKYPASNLMRKRMLYVSRKIGKLQGTNSQITPKVEKAKKELYKSQSNCAYWHGIFGGIYTNHLRHGVYSHIIKAEEVLHSDEKTEEIEMIDLKDNPGNVICARNKSLALFVDPDYAGSLFEIDYKPLSYNLVDTVSRRYESYHEKLNKKRKANPGELKKKVDDNESIDLYEVLGVRERNLDKFLNYDTYRKFSSICHIMDLKTSFSDFVKSTHRSPGKDDLFGPYSHQIENKSGKLIMNLRKDGKMLRINKCIVLERKSEIFIRFDLENVSSEPAKFIFGTEFNWSIEDKSFLRQRRLGSKKELTLTDRFLGITIKHIFEKPVNVWSFPVYTLSESERGLGKNFQEISLLFCKKLALKSKQKFSMDTQIRISG